MFHFTPERKMWRHPTMSCYHRSRKKTVLHCFCVRYSCSDLSLLLLAIFLLFQPGTSLVSTSSERPTVAGSTSTIRSVLANSTVTTTTISSHPNATDQSSSLNQSRTVSMSTNSSLSSISTTTSSSNTSSTPSPVSISSMATKKDVTSGTKIKVTTSQNATDSIVTTTKAVPILPPLKVSAGTNKRLQLPKNEIILTAYVMDEPLEGKEFHYKWSMITFPKGAEKQGSMTGPDSKTFILKDLVAGLYTLKLEVTGNNRAGEAYVNVTVIPPKRINKPPVAIIKPTSLQIKLPTSAILDGSDSTDDMKVVKYKWEEVSGPINDRPIESNASMLKLNHLEPGKYQFKLTVTDSDGATNSTLANVTAIKETDYRPTANAGSDVVINLPENSVTLYGNASTDDKGIVSYEWTKSSDDHLVADMMGVRSPVLKISNLEVGNYKFTLKVTDTGGQNATADVHVFVKPEVNQPPVAVTAGEITVVLPVASLVLDGQNSTDDKNIETYSWKQTSGPQLTLSNSDRNIATATGDIKVAVYMFKLTVYDIQKQSSSANLKITVTQKENKAPMADAGGDKVIQLPKLIVLLDGSRSHDDQKIVRYQWTRDPSSLAAGEIANNSNSEAVLQLINLIAGRYIFTLHVFDSDGLSSSDSASIIVKPDPSEIDKMVLELDTDIEHFTVKSLKNIESQLGLLLHMTSEEDAYVLSEKVYKDFNSGHLKIEFYAVSVTKETKVVKKGIDVLRWLKPKLSSQTNIFEYSIVDLNTFVCQNNCSGHGKCDQYTKQCFCEAFWMQNYILTKFFHGENNCDWSILYVVIVCFLIVVGLAGFVWLTCCIWKRRLWRWRTRKRPKYSLLSQNDNVKENFKMLTKTRLKAKTGTPASDSDLSSEDTLFVNHKSHNGQIWPKNGINQHIRPNMLT
ncbi:dyslexia-associated protein KIAA0319-like protein isoform X2 [Octopus sinensis]|uniref:Dyslexia-associated protein KIAA0319-like protein isoform X2 n=1 Tax=Octopus sinensis TaxID=2607531 RepID=A0A6P7S9R2_9MOLL|nr:dyslexia-associated protein KIAA0319-like protein isoform X2 [Octopus sinensis]